MDKQNIVDLAIDIVSDLDKTIVRRNEAMMRYECACCDRRANFLREFEHEEWCVVLKIENLKAMLRRESK